MAARGQDATQALVSRLRECVLDATDLPLTLTDPNRPDNPLIWVNPAFTRVTGWSADDCLGRNCRFLQSPDTDPEAVAELGRALAEHRPVTTTLLNVRRDGSPFWNRLTIMPIRDDDGRLIGNLGVQTDVSAGTADEAERAAALSAERTARRAAEQTHGRLALMAEATSILTATLDMDDLLDRLAALCVPLLADWVVVTLVDGAGEVRQAAAAHRDGRNQQLRRFAELWLADLPAGSPLRRVLTTGEPLLVPTVRAERIAAVASDPEIDELIAELGATSLMTVPLVARRRILGSVSLISSKPGHTFTTGDVDIVAELCRRAALAIDNLRLYQQEHAVAEALQRSMLPALPRIDGVTAAAQYVSASTAAEIGGDFYELLELPDGSVGLAIGDVVGHDLTAAAAMGHLRGLLRACAWDAPEPDPGGVLDRVDRLVQGLQVAPMATVVYARALRPTAPGAPWRLAVGNAGHLPLLVRHPDGSHHLLDDVRGLLLGVDATRTRETRWYDVPRGSTLIGYTDGLVERPGGHIDLGTEVLLDRLAEAPSDADPVQLCAQAVGPSPDRRDDIAVLVVRFD